MMKNLSYLTLIGLMSCAPSMDLIDQEDVHSIEVYNGITGNHLDVKSSTQSELIYDLNNSELCKAIKYIKTHRILVFHKNNEIDTIWTNGYIHQVHTNGKYRTYESSDNLIEKYCR